MRCYKCNSVLSDTDFCNGCGADVTIYKKIVRLSNTYYNMGLAKAKVRDLSGAADLLRRSVRAYKHNTKARNLLGLVYYEMGECVEAMSEWVISKSFQPEKNLADRYLAIIQSNPTRLDIINQTAKKFNTALNYANEGSDDLAIVQLKRILNMVPNYVKASQLLALLYMKNDDYEKARKVLLKVKKVDRSNTLTISYLAEIDRKIAKDTGKPISRLREKEPKERPALSGDDVIIPQTGYREGNAAAVSIINVLVGIVLGVALVYFLITPAREKAVRNTYNDKINEYSEKLASNGITIATLEETIRELQKEKDELESITGGLENDVEKIKTYDLLLSAASKYATGDYAGCADIVSGMEQPSIATEGFVNCYNSLKSASYGPAAQQYYQKGVDIFNSERNYDQSVDALEKAYLYNPNDVNIVYALARSYRAENNWKLNDAARKYFTEVINMAPDSQLAVYARNYLGM